MAGLFILDDERIPPPTPPRRQRAQALLLPIPERVLHRILPLEALVGEILRQRMGSPRRVSPRKRKRDAEEALRWVRGVAACPWDPALVVSGGAEGQILTAREALFMKKELIDLAEVMPELVRSSSEPDEEVKHIREGAKFQITVPEWTGPLSERELSDYKFDIKTSRYLGTQVWSVPDVIDEGMAASGRVEPCICASPGSISCVRHHVSKARNQLRSELGPFFSAWGFDSTGEEASNILTPGEQLKFHALEQLNPFPEPDTFWGVVSKYFPLKNQKDLVSYFFNVYVLRRMGNRTRSEFANTGGDEEVEEEEDNEQQNEEAAEESTFGLSQRLEKGRRK